MEFAWTFRGKPIVTPYTHYIWETCLLLEVNNHPKLLYCSLLHHVRILHTTPYIVSLVGTPTSPWFRSNPVVNDRVSLPDDSK
jgi:hypothetical protein